MTDEIQRSQSEEDSQSHQLEEEAYLSGTVYWGSVASRAPEPPYRLMTPPTLQTSKDVDRVTSLSEKAPVRKRTLGELLHNLFVKKNKKNSK